MASEIWKYSIWVERVGFCNISIEIIFLLPEEQMQRKHTVLSADFLWGRLNKWIIYQNIISFD